MKHNEATYIITVQARAETLSVGLLEQGRLIEYEVFPRHSLPVIDRVCIGKVKEVSLTLHAAFLDCGAGKSGFLPLRGGRKLACGEELLVQIVKEGTQDKGYLLTEKISLSGKYLVLTPFDRRVSLSSKIQNPEERARLHRLASCLPNLKQTGYILRTDAQGQSDADIQREAEELVKQWETIRRRAPYATSGSILYQPMPPVLTYIKNLPTGSIQKIVVDDTAYYRQLRDALQSTYPALTEIVCRHDQGRFGIQEFYKLTSQLQRALAKRVPLRKGGFLVIEQTEAMAVIDVNSGSPAGRMDFEELAYSTNCAAAEEIARQMRLRNLSGIIVVDFIDMRREEHKTALLDLLRKATHSDPRRTTIHGMTNLGLVEISRQKKSLPLQVSIQLEAGGQSYEEFLEDHEENSD